MDKAKQSLADRHSKLLWAYSKLCDSDDWSTVGTIDSYLIVGRWHCGWLAYHIKNASSQLRQDKDVILAAVKQDRRALAYASDDLKNDRQVVLAAVEINVSAFEFASPQLKADKAMVQMVIEKDRRALQFASPQLQEDFELANNRCKFLQRNSVNFESPPLVGTMAENPPSPCLSLEQAAANAWAVGESWKSSPLEGCVFNGESASDTDEHDLDGDLDGGHEIDDDDLDDPVVEGVDDDEESDELDRYG